MSLERLESRHLLAGNVSIGLSGGTLFVRGDNAANHLQWDVDGSEIVVTGLENTRINGGASSFRLAVASVTGDIKMDLKRGNDIVSMTGITLTGKVEIKTRQGNDRVELENVTTRDVMIDMDGGDDVVQLVQVTSRRDTWVFLGSGNDVLAAPSLTVPSSFRIKGAGGSQTAVLGEVQADGPTLFKLGSGNDQIAIVGPTEFTNDMNFDGQSGDDLFVVNPRRADPSATAAFRRLANFRLRGGSDTVAFDDGAVLDGRLEVRGDGGFDRLSGTVVEQITSRRIDGIESRQSVDIAQLVDAVFATLTRAGVDVSLFDTAPQSQAPVITVASGQVTYVENDPAIAIDGQLTITDADSQNLQSATVQITSGLAMGEDLLEFTPVSGITGSYNAATGTLTFTGSATVASYQMLLRSVQYRNTSEDPSEASRVIRFLVSDGELEGTAQRTVAVQAVDDVGNLTLPGEFSDPAVPVERSIGTLVEFTAEFSDPDNDVVFQLDLEESGIPAGVALPTIDLNTGRFRWTPTVTGQFVIRVIAVVDNGFVDQETFILRIV